MATAFGNGRRYGSNRAQSVGWEVEKLKQRVSSNMATATNTSATIDRGMIERIVREIVAGQSAPQATSQPAASARSAGCQPADLRVSISARHVHLCDEHVETLFGPGHTLTPMKDLPGRFLRS